MKKLIGLILSIVLAFSILCACQDTSQTSQTPKTDDSAEISKDSPYVDVVPLEEEVELTVAALPGSTVGAISAIMKEMGAFEAGNIKLDQLICFGNGPVMVEAYNSWDVGTYGLGGTLAGVLNDVRIVGIAAYDCGPLGFFASVDSDIVKAGINSSVKAKQLYGTAEQWKGKEVYYPVGSTLHYTLSLAMQQLGLKMEDIRSTHTDVPNANTALLSGSAEVAGLWTAQAISALSNEKLVKVIDAADVGADLYTVLVATPRCYNDPQKSKAVAKWIELYYRTIDWMYSSKENFSKAGDIWQAWNEQEGYASTKQDNLQQLVYPSMRHCTIQEGNDMFEEITEVDGQQMSKATAVHYSVLEFYIEQGNYQEESKPKLIENTDGQFLKAAYQAYQGTTDTYADETLDYAEWIDTAQ